MLPHTLRQPRDEAGVGTGGRRRVGKFQGSFKATVELTLGKKSGRWGSERSSRTQEAFL